MNKKRALIASAVTLTILMSIIVIHLSANSTQEYKYKTCEQVQKEQKNYVLALKTKDASYCGKTGNPEFCTAQVTKNTAFCNTQPDKNYCLAIIKGDETLCEENDWWCRADASRKDDYCNNLPTQQQAECTASAQLNEEYYNQKICD